MHIYACMRFLLRRATRCAMLPVLSLARCIMRATMHTYAPTKMYAGVALRGGTLCGYMPTRAGLRDAFDI